MRRSGGPVVGALLAVAVAGCMTSHDVVTGRWALAEVSGRPAAAEAELSLLPDGTFTMRPGCNTGGGTYTIDGNRLDTDALSLTMMACGEPADAQEATVVAVLEADPRFEIETGSGRLRLMAGDDTLVFVAR